MENDVKSDYKKTDKQTAQKGIITIYEKEKYIY